MNKLLSRISTVECRKKKQKKKRIGVKIGKIIMRIVG